MTVAEATTADRIVECFGNADLAGLARYYADNVLLDVSAPRWRAQLQGRAAAAESVAEDAAKLPNLRTAWSRATVTADAVAVESECRFDGAGGEYLWRCVDLVRIVAGEIVEHTQYCTGCWPPDQISRQVAEAPMVRW